MKDSISVLQVEILKDDYTNIELHSRVTPDSFSPRTALNTIKLSIEVEG